MSKRYLNVPFVEKDEAKKLGAKWDPSVKKWYIPENINADIFTKWLIHNNASNKLNILSPKYCIISGKHTCWKCKKDTKVWTIQLYKENITPNHNNLISYIKYLSDDVVSEISKHTKFYKKDYSKTINEYYYMNHCEHCGAKLGDFSIYEEPSGAFHSWRKEEKDIKSYLVDSPFYQPVD